MDLGIQQKELARRLGVSPWTLRLWEVGRTRPAIGQWVALIHFLGYDPIPTTEDIPSRVKTIRRRLGISQKELASILEVDPATVQKWEDGKGIPMELRGSVLSDLFEQVGITHSR